MKKLSLPWVLAIFSLLVFVGITQYFQHVYMLSTETTALFEADESLERLFLPQDSEQFSDNHRIKVVYFWQSNCPCDATVITHYKELMADYGSNADFLMADLSPTPRDDKLSEFALLTANKLSEVRASVSHTPSVGVWDENGKLTYFGPHNLGFVCNAKTSFLINVLDALLRGTQSKNTNTVGDGCFCAVEPLSL